MEAVTEFGKKLVLQEPPLKSGGEGSVYIIVGFPNVVAKIYTSKADAKEREMKIRQMAAMSENTAFKNTGILEAVAWPLAALYNTAGEFIGFGMTKVPSKYELDNIYSQSRNTTAGMNMQEKIKVLISLCEVVEKLHAYNQVVGDFNPNNMKIDDMSNVKFVDVDSYHFNSGRNIYPCVVCASGYVAPELIKKCKGTTYLDCFNSGNKTFTKETDCFSLAIHCFRILMNGCHPFTCKLDSNKIGSTPAPSLDKRAENGETPFFVKVPNYTTPAWAPDVKSLPPYLHDLFYKAFVDGHTNPSMRPTATEWKQVLEKYLKDITACQNPLHYYWKKLKTCPYCEAEKHAQISPSPKLVQQTQNTGNRYSYINRNIAKKNPKISFNSLFYWFITMSIAIYSHNYLRENIYLPLYSANFDREGWVAFGTFMSFWVGVIGTVVYSLSDFCKGMKFPYKFKFRDYCLSQLSGVLCVSLLFLFLLMVFPIWVFVQEKIVIIFILIIILSIFFNL